MGFGCIICAEDYNSSESEGDKTPMCIKSCGHVFHKSCLSLWLDKSGTCPICREPTNNSAAHITKLHFQRLSMDNSSILGLLDETDKLQGIIKSKDALLASKDALIATKDAMIAAKDAKMRETQGDLLKVSKDLTSIMARFTKTLPNAASSTSHNNSRDDPSGTRLISSRTISGRAPVSSGASTDTTTRRVRVTGSTVTVAPRISSRGRSTSSGTLRQRP